MTTRERWIYMGWVLLIWFFTYWRRIVLALVVVGVVVWLLTGCVVGTLPTATPTGTPWATNTPTPMLTAVNISPTPEPTPTQEWACAKGSYVTVFEDVTLLEPDMITPATVSYTSGDGVFHFEQAIIQANETVYLLPDRTSSAWMVIAADGAPRVGWLKLDYLPDECR
jgi:hypothetical protein